MSKQLTKKLAKKLSESLICYMQVLKELAEKLRQSMLCHVQVIRSSAEKLVESSVCHLQVAKELAEKLPSVRLQVFSDRDLEPKRAQVEAALDNADVFFGSLLFDYDQVEWLKSRVEKVPLRLVFESALELMSTTQIGTFQAQSEPTSNVGQQPE